MSQLPSTDTPNASTANAAPQAGITYEWRLQPDSRDAISNANLLQEFLWGVEGTHSSVQSIEEVYRPDTEDVLDYKLDGIASMEHLEALKVFSDDHSVENGIQTLLSVNVAFKGWTLSPARSIALEDWAESWKQHWDVTPVHERLTICPSWLEYQPKSADEKIIKLDPGAAFGTGTHNTTCLMLQALDAHAEGNDFSQLSVLDVGTGSGILAVYAAMLGCRSVIGVDNDINSPSSAQANAQMNGVDAACTFSMTPLEDLCHTRHDLVLANIIAPVILSLLPEMLLRLAPGGTLLLSGLIEKNLPEIIAALETNGLADIQTRQLGDWYSVAAVLS